MGADPTIEALREVLAESFDEIRLGIADLTVNELNAVPGGEETNSIAVIVTHALGATRSWLSLAMGAPLPDRDRDAEFRTIADEGFVSRTEDEIARCLDVLVGAAWDPGRVGTPNWNSRLSEEPRTAAYALAHALEHLGEHVGHLHVTRGLVRPAG